MRIEQGFLGQWNIAKEIYSALKDRLNLNRDRVEDEITEGFKSIGWRRDMAIPDNPFTVFLK